jgi:hypothetical protein
MTGTNAIHIKGHTGFMPFPASSSSVVAMTAGAAASRGRLRTKAIEVSPERALVKCSELLLTLVDAASEIEDDKAVRERAELEGDLDGIVGPQLTCFRPACLPVKPLHYEAFR